MANKQPKKGIGKPPPPQHITGKKGRGKKAAKKSKYKKKITMSTK